MGCCCSLMQAQASTCQFAAAALAGASGLLAGPVEYSHSCARRTWRACICRRSEHADAHVLNTAMQPAHSYRRAAAPW